MTDPLKPDASIPQPNDAANQREEPMADDPVAVFHEWASEADQRAWAGLTAADPTG